MNLITSLTDYNAQVKDEGIGEKIGVSNVEKKEKSPTDYFEKITDKIINKKDVTEMVTTPRAIYKGYLAFTTGTALNAISAILKNFPKISKVLNISGILMSIYGTFNFVKPLLIREKDLTNKEK